MSAAKTASRPNILLIMTDQHRYDVLSAYGNQHVSTPNLQRLAEEGVTFETCYSTSTVCAPARASIETGKYVHAHGLWTNGVTLPPQPMVSRQLRDAGYRCGLIGKLHLSPCFGGRDEAPIDDGFDEFRRWAHDPRHGSPKNDYHRWLEANHPDLWAKVTDEVDRPGSPPPASSMRQPGQREIDSLPTRGHYSTWVAEKVEEFFTDQSPDEPFFLWANFYDPHHPFAAPREYLDQYPPGSVPPPVGSVEELADKPDYQRRASERHLIHHGAGFLDSRDDEIDYFRRAYYAMVTMIDDKVGQILRSLQDHGLDDNTLVIFTSDHGEMLGDHGLLLKGPMAYEMAVRVPLIMRWPGRLPAVTRCSSMAGLHDIGVTIGVQAGASPLPGSTGHDLVAIACGESAGRDWAYSEFRAPDHADQPGANTTMLRHGDTKIIVRHGTPVTPQLRDGELYDLATDPNELVNLWSSHDHLSLKADLLGFLCDVRVQLEDRSAPQEAPW